MEKYVVVSSKKMPSGSRVLCASVDKETAREVLKNMESDRYISQFGPFEVMTVKEAEDKRMYG